MKYLFILLLSLSVSANEMDRIESIVKDIQDIRAEHASCLESLEEQTKINNVEQDKKLLDESITKNRVLVGDLNTTQIENKVLVLELNASQSNTKELEKKLQGLETLLSKQDKTIGLLKKKIETLSACSKNIFPTLIMKESKVLQKKVKFKARTFELINDASIFDSINGKKVTLWKGESLFTSNVKTQNWIRITGYFIEGKWQRSKEELWIKIENIKKR